MRHFTVDEATALLAEVAPLAEQMRDAYRALRAAQAELEPLKSRIAGNGGGLDKVRYATLEQAVAAASRELGRILARLDELGVQVKDLELGLLDFPTVHPGSGETVLLCWRAGEATIGHWHGLDEGYAGRKPLPF